MTDAKITKNSPFRIDQSHPAFVTPFPPFFSIFVKNKRMVVHPDQRYIEGLLQNDKPLVEDIYRRFVPSIRNYVLKNRGSVSDAADIFQEALMDIYQQAKHKQLQLSCPFEPFFLLVCKRKWLNQLKKKGHDPVTKTVDDLSEWGEDVFAETERLVAEEEKARLFLREFRRLGDKCREIIRMSLSGERQEKVAAALGVSYGYLRKKKSECMATLLSYINGPEVRRPNKT